MRIPYFKVLDEGERQFYNIIMKKEFKSFVTQFHKISLDEEEEGGKGGIIFESNLEPPDGFDKS